MSHYKTRGKLEKRDANMPIHLQCGSSAKGRRAGEERRAKEAGSQITSSSLKINVREKNPSSVLLPLQPFPQPLSENLLL